MELEKYEVGERVHIKTIDNLEIKGTIEAYTSDALLIKTVKTTVRLHPHEIYFCIKQ